ncbi:hypothetical protein KIL84_006143 [Mauremys mutica]|uniref:Uncharacterized protein n=1 Tax=Mauremys mutica TaxID=74926 RepID=A0A9D3XHN8_9SAUR|nr:hypothetical protein KIL84_006143 [Mauremys mutica]
MTRVADGHQVRVTPRKEQVFAMRRAVNLCICLCSGTAKNWTVSSKWGQNGGPWRGGETAAVSVTRFLAAVLKKEKAVTRLRASLVQLQSSRKRPGGQMTAWQRNAAWAEQAACFMPWLLAPSCCTLGEAGNVSPNTEHWGLIWNQEPSDCRVLQRNH